MLKSSSPSTLQMGIAELSPTSEPSLTLENDFNDMGDFSELSADGMSLVGSGELIDVVSEVIPKGDYNEFVGRDGLVHVTLPADWQPQQADEFAGLDLFAQTQLDRELVYLSVGQVTDVEASATLQSTAQAEAEYWAGEFSPFFEDEVNGNQVLAGSLSTEWFTDRVAFIQLEDGRIFEVIVMSENPETPLNEAQFLEILNTFNA